MQQRDGFLSQVRGVVHVGANLGQERERYGALGLAVLWVEPNPPVFSELQENIRAFPNQRAVQALVTDLDDQVLDFHVSNNHGASSSILPLADHRDIWPEVDFVSTLTLTSVTLATLYRREGIDPADYQALVMDTQGSELLVLRGAAPLLRHFRFIKTEVADFEAYAGCCQVTDLAGFLADHGFTEHTRHAFARRAAGGCYYDIVYQRGSDHG